MSVVRRLAPQLRGALSTTGWRTRFAPAPTGFLHLGHLVNAVHVWGIARAYGGRILLRVEDHDATRCRPEYEAALHEDLAWLGLDRDLGSETVRQSDRDAYYTAAFAALSTRGLTYACVCTRREIAAAQPRAAGEELCYPGTCRDRGVDPAVTQARRVRMADGVESFDDLRLGAQRQEPGTQCGDLLVRDRNGHWTYQFAVVVDDLAQEIDVIIRGEDLLSSTGRQWQLARLLGRRTMPQVLHHALVTHPDGTKLSKSNGDTSIRERRRDGVSAAALFGEAAWLAGLQASPRALTLDDLAGLFV